MAHYLFKVLVSAVLIVAISEAAKRSTLAGAVLASIPLTSVLAFIWLYIESGSAEKIPALSIAIFWLVIPSLILFILLPWLLRWGLGFWPSLLGSIAATAVGYGLMVPLLRRFGVET